MTYLWLNIIFIAVAFLALGELRSIIINKTVLITAFVLLILTAIFDPLLIYYNVFAYNQSKLIGVTIFGAPVEDFFYVIFAILVIPGLWHLIGKVGHERNS